MNYFKELKEVEEVTGWGKLYYNFIDLDRYDSMLMLNYLIDTEPLVMQHCFDEGYEDYLQYSDSFIQEKIIGVTPHLIRKMMDDVRAMNGNLKIMLSTPESVNKSFHFQ